MKKSYFSLQELRPEVEEDIYWPDHYFLILKYNVIQYEMVKRKLNLELKY